MLKLPNWNREVSMSLKTRILLREMNSLNSQSFITASSGLEQRFANLPAIVFFIHASLQSLRPGINILIVNISL
jgi:hypothetical protein